MKPHPTKSKPRIDKPSPRQPGKGGRVMWHSSFATKDGLTCMWPNSDQMHAPIPVLVLDLSENDRERRVALAKKAVIELKKPRPFCRDCADNDGICPASGQSCDPDEAIVRAVLASLGDTPAGEGRGE